jgi:pSer/pThr/pTyr-binding forkhead associated (FHA) protein
MWKLSIDDDENNRTVVKLALDTYTIGRGEENAIRLADRNVSRRHAELVKNGKGWLIKDLGSFNGCYVNGERVKGQAKVRRGSLLEIGDYRIQLTRGTLDTELEDQETANQLPALGIRQEQDRLVVIGGPGVGTQYALGEGRFLIGRGEDCVVSLAHASVSRAHAEIVGAGGSYELVDHGSSNGLYVNGTRLVRTFLHAGDVIELGDSFVKFVPRGSLDRNVPLAEQATALIPLDATREIRPTKRRIAYVGAIVVLGVLISIAVREQRHTRADLAKGPSAVTKPVRNETDSDNGAQRSEPRGGAPLREAKVIDVEPVTSAQPSAAITPEKRVNKASDTRALEPAKPVDSKAHRSENPIQSDSEIIRKSPF